MKRIIIAAILLGVFLELGVALAGPDIGVGGTGVATEIGTKAGYATKGISDTALSETIGRVVRIVLGLVGTVFLVLTVYSGILWMTAQGNEEQVTKALGILKTAVVGLTITLAAYGITAFVLYYVEISTGQYGGAPGVGGASGASQSQDGLTWSQWADNWRNSANSMGSSIKDFFTK